MNNQHNGNGRKNKNQQRRNDHRFPKPIIAEIKIPSEEDFVKIPVDEYAELVARSTLLDAVKRQIEGDSYDSYIRNGVLRQLLDMPKEETKLIRYSLSGTCAATRNTEPPKAASTTAGSAWPASAVSKIRTASMMPTS